MNRKKAVKQVISAVLSTVMIVTLLTGIPTGLTEAATTLNNPRKDSTGVVTWDCVYFGSYPQTDSTGKSKDPIKWRVLSVNGNDAFLVADTNLDVQRYNDTNVDVTWETCTMRSWLNGYGSGSNVCGTDYSSNNFIDRAFTAAEQNAIIQSTVVNDNNPVYGTAGGNDTKDKVFLLSYDEVTNSDYGFSSSYSERDTARKRKNTAYVAKGGTISSSSIDKEGNTDYWWLRSPGDYSDIAMCVSRYGYVNHYVSNVHSIDYAVCPALHLNLSSSTLWSYAGTVSNDGSSTTVKETVKQGDVITDSASKAAYKVTQSGSSGNTVEYTAPAGGVTSVVIPAQITINGAAYNVTSIADKAFLNNKKITKVVIGSNVKTIGNSAFSGCTKLKTLSIGANVTTIGSKAFYKCTALTKVTIPAKITTIGTSAFYGCSKLKTVSMGANVTTINANAFYKCIALTKITIPAKVSKIGKKAFYGCKKLKSITIKTKKLSSKKVGSKAFTGIYSKAAIKVPKSKLKTYKKLLKAKGVSTKAAIKK